MKGKTDIIYFTFDNDEKITIKTILHEIAHYVLNHKNKDSSPTGDPAEENEAKDLVSKWMKNK